MLAGRWTLLDRSGEPLLAECERRGVSVVAAAPYNSGLLSRTWPADDGRFNYVPAKSYVLAQARALATTCQDYGTTLPEAAVAFPLRHPAVASVVAGMRNATQAASTAAYISAEIPEPAWRVLDRIATGSAPA
jgi:D-threo-aldose 1-dehydrogenase